MKLEEVVAFLQERINQPLPGYAAQREMSARPKNGLKFKPIFDEPSKSGAVLILLYPHEREVQFPLIQRPQYNGVHSGQVALPGGKRDEGDNDLIETALREAHEEVGIPSNAVRIIGPLSELYVQASNIKVLPVLGYATKRLTFRPDVHEVDELINANLDHLLDEKNQKVTEININESITLEAPFFDLSQKVVWGATAMILNEFVRLFKG